MKEPRAAGTSIIRNVLKRKAIFLVAGFALLVLITAANARAQGKVAPESRIALQEPAWYYPRWLTEASYAPVFEVKDTMHKYGRYTSEAKQITIKDLIKFHGHLCGGLVEAACAMKVALDTVFPDGITDRTDLRIVSNNSACGGDVAAYLTGARVRFASHTVDKSLKGGGFIVQCVSTGRTVRVKRNPKVYPTEVKAQMKKIESGAFSADDIDLFGKLQWAYAKRLVNRPLNESFLLKEMTAYQWPDSNCKDLGKRKDNDYKRVP